MIKIKLFLVVLVVAVLCVPMLVSEDTAKNVVAFMSSSLNASNNTGNSSSFVGQTTVVDTAYTADFISQMGFVPLLAIPVENQIITFENKTEQKEFDTNVVPVKVNISVPSGYTITKIKYSYSKTLPFSYNSGEEVVVVEDVSGIGESYNFAKDITFNTKPGFIQFYAQCQSGSDIYYNYSSPFQINFSEDVPDDIVFINPDPVSRVMNSDPLIETSAFDIKTTPFDFMIKNNTTGDESDVIFVSSETPNGIYSKEKGAICFQYSTSVLSSFKLIDGNNYDIIISSHNAPQSIILELKNIKVVSGGVADILAYPSPFNPKKGQKITIKYFLADASNVTIRIYDKAGKIVCKLLDNEQRPAGAGSAINDRNEIKWDGRNYAGETLATGPYICEVIAKSSKGESRRYAAFALVGK